MQKVDWKNFIFDLQWNKNLLLTVAEPIASKNISNVDVTPWRRFDVAKFFRRHMPAGFNNNW